MEFSDAFKEQVDKLIDKSIKEQHLQLLVSHYHLQKKDGRDVSGIYAGICELCKELYGFSNVTNPQEFSFTNIYR
jgi:hypothetical protein